MIVLYDAELERTLGMAEAIAVVEGALASHARGELYAPPRHAAVFPGGRLVFTIGADPHGARVAGFRTYGVFPRTDGNRAPAPPPAGVAPRSDEQQLVAVFDTRDGGLKGVCLGERLGILRTGAIGGAAIRALARPGATTVGLVGTGRQAAAQLEAACAVREVRRVRVHGRSEPRRQEFARRWSTRLGIPVEAVDSPGAAAADTDIVILATSSTRPVLPASALRPGMHLTTVGPKTRSRHELDPAAGDRADLIATDSIEQLDAYDEPFFLPAAARKRVVSLGSIVNGDHPGRSDRDQVTLFCSVGLAGTEVLVADAALRAHAAR